MSPHARRIVIAALTAAGIAAAAGPVAGASAATSTAPQSLATVQAKAAAAITLRVDDLTAAVRRVDGTPSIGSGAAGLATYLQSDIAPLQGLEQKIAADTTVSQAEADAATIYSDYRVLALVLPAAGIAGDADALDATTLPKLSSDSAQAVAHVNARNQATLTPLIADLNLQIGAATTATSGLASTVLAFTPSQWNADHSLLSTAKSSDSSARSAAQRARHDVQEIRSYLKSNGGGAGTTTTT